MQPKAHQRYDLMLLMLLMLFVLIVVVSGYSPRSRVDWTLENLLVLFLVGALVAVSDRFACRLFPSAWYSFSCAFTSWVLTTPMPRCRMTNGVQP